MNTHKPDPAKPIDTTNLAPTPTPKRTPCRCDPDHAIQCLLHFDLDGYIIAKALTETTEEK